MTKRRATIFMAGILLASMAGAAEYSRVLSAEAGWTLQEALQQEAQVKEISGYRQWERINPNPWLITTPTTEMG
jgi:hypothetical protein